jgi:SpoVK/Ycf46/Vps4 family AAA+-type ATPase
VGQTENAFIKATLVFEQLAPCIILIDEIEKALSGAESSGATDGGTMSRAYGTFLSWLNDTQAPVMVVGTSNRLDKLGDFGDTLARKGRFDEIFFVDWPNPEARKYILSRELEKRHIEPASLNLQELAQRTEGFSGADLVALVKEADSEAKYKGESLSDAHLQQELNLQLPRTEVRKQEFAGLRKWARAHARPASSGQV